MSRIRRVMLGQVTPGCYRALTILLGSILRVTLGIKAVLRKDYRQIYRERFGYYDAVVRNPAAGKRLWIHAVSVGEVEVAVNLVGALRAAATLAPLDIVVSTTTRTGQQHLLRLCPHGIRAVYFPLDIPSAVARALSGIAPDVVCLLETEIWPNFVKGCDRRGIPVLLINGRISRRSVHTYRAMRRIMPGVLQAMRHLSVIAPVDAQRFVEIGAPEDRITVAGNLKYGRLAARREAVDRSSVRATYGVRSGDWVWVAGCTRRGEEEAVLEAYVKAREQIPSLRFIWAPRHPQFTPRVEALLRSCDLRYCLRSQFPTTGCDPHHRLVVVDTLGELFGLYGIADAAFSGGSLVPKGGHNFLEIAIWGIPPLYGPDYHDFEDAHELLATHNASIVVQSPENLAAQVVRLYRDTDYREGLRQNVEAAIDGIRGASSEHLRVVMDALAAGESCSRSRSPGNRRSVGHP